MGRGKKFGQSERLPSAASAPRLRLDGELYARPEPNPFTEEWQAGYEDRSAGRKKSYRPEYIGVSYLRYDDGYETAEAEFYEREDLTPCEREEMDRRGSSNT